MSTSARFARPGVRPSFLEGVLVALAAALSASVLVSTLGLLLPRQSAFALAVAALGLGYLLYLLARAPHPAGRVVALAAWVLATGLVLALYPDPWLQILFQAGFLWLVRVFWFQSGPAAALLDLGLVLAGLAAALWAGRHTGSPFLAVWCLFLVQALFGALPSARGRGDAPGGEPDAFDLAERAARSALRKLVRE